jgi:hypothetical protein
MVILQYGCCVKVIRFDIISTIACDESGQGSIRLNIGTFTIVAIYYTKQCFNDYQLTPCLLLSQARQELPYWQLP